MLTRFAAVIPARLLLLLMLSLSPMFAIGAPDIASLKPEDSASETPKTLPLGTLLDANGQPMALPQQHQGAMHYQAPKQSPIKPRSNPAPSSQRNHAGKGKSKASNTKRITVANDPTCRWLDQRLKQLQIQQQQRYGHQQRELTLRRKEWRCLDCAGKGPEAGDHARCQIKR